MNLSFAQAVTEIHKEAQNIAALHAFPKMERVDLEKSVGRTTFGEILSPEDLPAAPTSAMDGFAVRAAHTLTASPQTPLLIPITGSLAAGDGPPPKNPLANPLSPACWEIMTGATFPAGFDACIRIEDVEVLASSQQIKIQAPAGVAQNCRQKGEDFKKGAVILKSGHQIKNEDILPLAALGLTEIPVFCKPRVALISTGKELVDCAQQPKPGQIRNSTAPYLTAVLKSFGAEVEHLATVPDDGESFKKVLTENIESYDLILTTGAISVGRYDFVAGALEELGAQIFFKKVEVRPGKPLLFAKIPAQSKNKVPIFCLPGNPLASAVGLRFFVLPFLRTLLRQAPEIPLRVKLQAATKSSKEATTFVKGKLRRTEGSLIVEIQAEQRASLLHPLLSSDVWVALPPSANGEWSAASEVDAYPFLA
jgi:molybdopterin molybdotransferase